MIELSRAREGQAMLSTVITVILEDALPSIVRLPLTDEGWNSRTDGLLQLGRDVEALAAAAAVLNRLSAEEERP